MKIKLFTLLNLSQHDAVCSILKIDKLRIMLDCGINEKYDYSVYKKHQKKIQKVDIILLSHAETQYHGALPYLFYELGCKAEIYSTLPVSDLSLVNMFDFVLNRLHPSLPHDKALYQKLYKNIADLYDKINKVKFQQHIVLDIKGKSLGFKPYHIGHTVGACAWCISIERRNIFYLVTYNHIDEKILNGMNFLNFDEKKIDLLITSSNNIKLEYRKIKDKENELKQYIEYASKNNGSVILTSASTSRMYELLLFVLNIWSNKGPWSGPLYLYHNFMGLLHLAHSQLEFMSDSMTDDFYTNGDNPFRHFIEQNRHEEKLFNADVKLCRSPNDIDLKAPGKLIITNMSNLFFGSAGEILNSVWNNQKDLLIMTEKREFYEGYLKTLKQKKTFPLKVDVMGASFFNDLATKEEEAEKKAAEPADVTSVGDQETMITEEEFQPINKSALQSSLFGTKGFPAFHFSESKTKANDYGETIPEKQFKAFKKHTAKIDPFPRENNVNATSYAAAIKAKFEPYFFEEDNIVFPQVGSQSTGPEMRLVEMDLNGVSDGESMVKIINSLNPKIVLFVNGTQEDNKLIKDKIRNIHGEENILFSVPEENQQIDLISSAVEVKISSDFISNFNFNIISANGLEFVMSRIRGYEVALRPNQEKKEIEVGLVPLPQGMYSNDSDADKKFEAFGYVDLEKFRLVLEENNYSTYYKDKVLCVENVFFVRKEGGKVVIEGRYCKEYIEIRNLLYSFTSLQ